VLLGGRRYEVFDAAADYAAFAKRAAEALERAEPVARRERVVLAVENHKDFRAEELADLLKRAASDWVGACVDTGNNVALLEDPVAAVAALAPFAKTVHLKDLGAEEYADGFRVAEVPLGRGCLDLKELVAVLRRGNPRVPFHLEMITRDPLAIPCLTDKYWATLGGVSGRELARALARVRKGAGKQPLPRVSDLPAKEQLEREEENVRASFAFARDRKLIP
jgi:3-oxoisoapionate decarboxylase